MIITCATAKSVGQVPSFGVGDDVFHLGLKRTGRALADFPDVLCLGRMVIRAPTARARYLEA